MHGQLKCEVCGSDFYRRWAKSTKTPRFCSKKCMNTRVRNWNFKGKFRWARADSCEILKNIRCKFEKYVVRTRGCWGWKGCIHKSGYAPMNWFGNQQKNAHIVSWMLHSGPIPDNLLVLHKCDNRSCTNPEHLYLGNHIDNAKDRQERNPVRGSKHPNSRLVESDIPKILDYVKSGMIQEKIAKMFGISQTTVSRIKLGNSWNKEARSYK